MIKHFFLGFYVKTITGFDDTITRIPLLSSITKTRYGKLMFSLGNILAVVCAILLAIFFSTLLNSIPYHKEISAVLVFALAAAIYFDLFVHKPRSKAEEKINKCVSLKRCSQLIGIGFIASFATLIDDIVAYLPLFVNDGVMMYYSIAGIIFGTIVQVILVIYFSEKIAKVKYKEEIAAAGLVILGILILTGLI